MVDVSIQTKSTVNIQTDDADDDQEKTTHDEMEYLKMLVIRTVAPLQVSQSIAYRRALGSWSGLADLATFVESFWDSQRGGEAVFTASITCVGPWSVIIDSVDLERQVSSPQ